MVSGIQLFPSLSFSFLSSLTLFSLTNGSYFHFLLGGHFVYILSSPYKGLYEECMKKKKLHYLFSPQVQSKGYEQQIKLVMTLSFNSRTH